MRWNPPPTVLAQQSSLVPTELPDEAFPPSLVSMPIHMPSFSSSTCFRGEVMLKSSRHFRAGREEPRRCASIRDRSQPALAPPRTPVPSAHMSPGTQRGLSSCLLSPPTRGSLRPRTFSLPIFTSPNPYSFEGSPHVSPTRVGSLPARAHRASWPPTALAALLSNSKAASPRLSRRGRRAGEIACPAPWPALGP